MELSPEQSAALDDLLARCRRHYAACPADVVMAALRRELARELPELQLADDALRQVARDIEAGFTDLGAATGD